MTFSIVFIGERKESLIVAIHLSVFKPLTSDFKFSLFALQLQVPVFGHLSSCSVGPASGPMDSPPSIYSYSSYSLSPSFSTFPENSDYGFPSDSEKEEKRSYGPRPDTVGQRKGSQASPGPIRCRRRPRVFRNQHTASHLEQPGLVFPVAGSGMERSRDCDLETNLNIQDCTTEGDLLFAQKVRENKRQNILLQWLYAQMFGKDPKRTASVPRFGGRGIATD